MLGARAELRVQVAHGTARATRRLRGDTAVDLLITTPETALALQRRSALHPEALAAVLLAWPEEWEDDEAVAPAHAGSRQGGAAVIVATSRPDRGGGLVERYARRALTLGAPGLEGPDAPGPVRTVSVPWGRRVAVAAGAGRAAGPGLAGDLDGRPGAHEAIGGATALPSPEAASSRATRRARRPSSRSICRRRARLRQLAARARSSLLVPPAAESYRAPARDHPPAAPPPGALDAATTAAAARRAAIVGALETGALDRALLTLAPLFERHDAAAVAAALFELWTSAAGAAAPAALSDIPATARVYVGLGKKDGATVNDLVAVLTKEVRVDRGKIGRVELRDAFSLVEMPAQDAERVARRAQRHDDPPAGDGAGGPGDPRACGRRPAPPRQAPARPPEKR